MSYITPLFLAPSSARFAFLEPSPLPCQDRPACLASSRLFQREQQAARAHGQEALTQLLSWTPHSIQASSDLLVEHLAAVGISYRTLALAIRQTASVIEAIDGLMAHTHSSILLLCCDLALGNATLPPHPFHIICGWQPQPRRGRHWELPILGAYDPRAAGVREKWTASFTVRTCFCPPPSPDDYQKGGTSHR